MKWYRTACCLVIGGLLSLSYATAAEPADDVDQKVDDASSGLLKTKRPAADEAKPPETNAAEVADTPAKGQLKAPAKLLPWGSGLDAVRKKAQVDGKPVLVRVGANWCPWCHKLEEVTSGKNLQTELDRWALVYVDADESPAEVRQVGAGPIPALRVLDADGKVVAEKDGFLAEDELLDWLRLGYAKATGRPPGVLTADSEEPDEAAVEQLIDVLASQNARERETAIRRLLAHRHEAAVAVCEALAKGRLSTRLAALELLESWQAPVAGLDPWRPETLVADKHALLAAWAKETAERVTPEPQALTAEQLASAQTEIVRLLALGEADVSAAIERLAKFGPALLPVTYADLQRATTDRERERLLTLRYRLVASDALVLKWPAVASLLASAEIDVRHKAAARLAELATAADQALLLELFSDPDPLVREISLRGLQQVGGEKASEPLVKLLGDPEPSVRAAVLAQLAENPAPALVSSVAKYAAAERDPDLVVHAIRVLKAAGGKPAMHALMELLDHESWQARAEAAETLSEIAKSADNESNKADIYVALIDRLEDSDSFVVGRAIKGLENANLETAIEPLVKAAKAHPDLAAEAVEALTQASGSHSKSLPHLREFAQHADPRVRASAVRGLASDPSSDFEPLVVAGLQDQESEVRQAAAQSLFNNLQQSLDQSLSEQEQVIEQSGGRGLSVLDLFTNEPQPAEDVDQPKPDLDEEEIEEDRGKATEKKPTEEKAAEEKAAEEKATEEKATETKDTEAKPAGRQPQTSHDLWLAAFHRGRGQPKWVKEAVEPLTQMLQATSADERLIAALTLIAVGHIDRGLPVVEQVTAASPGKVEAASAVLVWLPWEARIKLFNSWAAKPSKDRSRHAAVMNLGKTHEPRAADTMWGMLAGDVDIEMVDAVNDALRNMYGLQSYGNPITKKQRKYADVAVQYGKTGTRWQKIVAMSVLLESFSDDVADLARAILDDPQTEPPMRKNALQFLLLSQTKADADKLAIEQLSAADPEQRKLALSFLARGAEAIQQLNDQLYLQVPSRSYDAFAGSSGQAIEVAPPTGLKAEMVEPLLADADSDVAAYAGYLLTTLGEENGLPPLLAKWRAKGRLENWSKLMYRAITALNDDAHTPILEEIAVKLRKYDKRDFYWTIRSIEGPQALKLRKKIRDEVGMDNLR